MSELPESRRAHDLSDRALSISEHDVTAAVRLAEEAVAAASGVSAVGEAWAQATLATVLVRLGRIRAGRDHAAEAVAFALPTHDAEVELFAYKASAEALSSLDEYASADQALAHARDALERMEDEGDWRWRLLLTEGKIRFRTRQFPAAEAAYREALALCHARGERTGEAKCRLNLAGALLELGDPREAARQAEEAAAIFGALGDDRASRYSRHNVAVLRYRIGEYERAAEAAERACELARAAGDRDLEAAALHVRGQSLLRTDDVPEAVETATAAVEKRRALGGRYALAVALEGLGNAARTNADPGRAVTAYLEALDLLEHEERPDVRATCLLGLGASQFALGQAHEAVKSLELALRICRGPGLDHVLAGVHELLAAIYTDLDEPARAERHRVAAQQARTRIPTPLN